MRARLWLLAALLAWPAAQPAAAQPTAAQITPDPAVVAPVQVLLDRLPDVVELAVAESERDGTPHAAWALADRMEAFLSGFESVPPWPEGSVAAGTGAEAAYRYADDVVALAARLPDEVAVLARTGARCASWSENATRDQAGGWIADRRRAAATLHGLLAALDEVAQAAPPPLRAQGVAAAAVGLERWADTLVTDVDACLEPLALRLGVEAPPPGPEARLVPERSFPTGTVRVVGAAPGPVEVAAPGLGWSSSHAAGPFQAAFTVPRDAGLGAHVVEVRSGVQSLRLALDVARAPTTLVADAPGSVPAGAEAVFVVGIETPAPGLLGNETVAGPEGNASLAPPAGGAPGAAVFRLVAPDAGPWRVRFRYEGSGVLEPSEAAVEVQVEPLAAARAPPPAATDGPPRIVVLSALLLLLLAAGVGAYALRGRLSPALLPAPSATAGAGAVGASAAVPGAPPPLPPRLVAAFAAVVAWLVRSGRARRSWTPREVGRHLAAEGLPTGPVVPAFEQARYGGAALPPERERAGLGWLERLRRRLGGGA